ncbi:MAG: homoserine dehydrogenase [Clostridia bacterium]|nr:homoserine dehydrogenase [Clostridia bacterium]
MKKINIGLLGMGNIGTGTYVLLEKNKDIIQEATGCQVEITKILDRDTTRDRGIYVDPKKFVSDIDDIVLDEDVQVVIELLGGVSPAKDFIYAALHSGKHVVTANKAAVAADMPRLVSEAKANNVKFMFEASVGGGIPVLSAINGPLQANHFEEVLGIVNGTTNYILTKMTDEGLEYADVLKKAQELGFAEADPTGDVEGLDAANKLSILIYLMFGKYVAPSDIPTTGITKVTKEDIKAAKEKGAVIKLLAKADKDTYSVGPELVSLDHPLSSVNNEFNAIYLTGDAVGQVMLYGKGAGPMPTASAVLGDVIQILKGEK